MINQIFAKLLLFAFFTGVSVNATTYYVSTASTSSDSNDGLSEASAWRTIVYAANHATVAGDIVYIKAGTYSNENITTANGTSGSPITFEGYKNTPGDVTNINWWNFEINRALDATKMPLLNGGNRSSGIAFNMGLFINLKNLQITEYESGVYGNNTANCIVENLIITTIGDINDSYSGEGIKFSGGNGYNTLKNCVVVNAAAEAIMLYCSDNIIENCKVYCDDAQTTFANTDYYLDIEGNNNTISDCYIERVGDLEHQGHGYTIKGDGNEYSGNVFENCVARNFEIEAFAVKHHEVHDNTFRNCTAYDATGFIIREGAHDNDFINCKAIDCVNGAIVFYKSEDPDATDAGNNNTFYNCTFKNSEVVIDYSSYQTNYDVFNNRLINCVVDGANYLFNCDRTNTDNEMINCIVTNVTNYKKGSYSLDFNFTNTDFWNNGFSTPSGINMLSINPQFADAPNDDYHLLRTSPCVDAGTTDTTGLSLPNDDVDGNSRIVDGNSDGSVIIDMGVYEYDVSTPVELVVFEAIVNDDVVTLNWETATEVNNYGFEIEASTSLTTNQFMKIGFVDGHGSSNIKRIYLFVDRKPIFGTIRYRLKQIDTDGSFEYSKVIEIVANISSKFSLNQNYPNPFNPNTVINFVLPTTQFVNLSVYNVVGEKVAELVNSIMVAGNHTVNFNASSYTSGIYLYRISVGSYTATKKMILLK